jgi:nucleoid-associated protein YgaU
VRAGVVVVAIGIGGATGATLGRRQEGPLTSTEATAGRPTIVVSTAVAGVVVTGAPSPVASPSAAQPTATPAPGGSTEYVVQPGDTLRSIAQQEYGDAEMWPRIYDANRDAIGSDPDALKAGTTLRIPAQ